MKSNNNKNDAKAGLIGTVGSSIGSFCVLPLTRRFVRMQTNLYSSKPFKAAFTDLLNDRAQKELRRVSGKSIFHSVTRSFTSLGIINIVLQRMKSEPSPAKRGWCAGSLAGLTQAVLTTWFSHSVIAGLSGQPQVPFTNIIKKQSICRRVYSIAILKNSMDQGLALMFSQMVKHYLLDEKLLSRGPLLSLTSGAVGAALSTMINMPLIATETNILSQPKRSLGDWVSQAHLRRDPRLLWRGCGIRIVRSSASLGIGLVVTDWMNNRLLGKHAI